MSSYPPPAIGNDLTFNPENFWADSDFITLGDADKRYLKLTGGSITGSLDISGILSASTLQIGGSTIDLSVITGITAGTATANKALIVNSSSNISGINSLGVSQCVIGGNTITGTVASYLTGITAGTAAASKALILDSSANISGINSLSCSTLLVGGSAPFSPIINTLISSDPAGNGSNNTNMLYYVNQGRFYNQRYIDSNNFVLLNCSGGGTYNDIFKYTHSAAPLLALTVSNSTLQGPTVNATVALTAPLLSIYKTITSGSSATILQWGESTNSAAKWHVDVFNASASANNHMTLFNDVSGSAGVFGINIGTGSGTSSSNGGQMVLNAALGTGSIITTGTSSCLGTLHINGGTTQTISSGWNYSPTGSSSYSGSTTNVSLYCYNNIWCRTSLLCSSDARLKDIITDIDSSVSMNLLKITPKWYSWRSDRGKDVRPQLGVIAQELLDNGLRELVHVFQNDDVLEEDLERGLKAKEQLVVSYDRLSLHLLEVVKRQQSRIDDLESMVNKLISRPVVQRWIKKTQLTENRDTTNIEPSLDNGSV